MMRKGKLFQFAPVLLLGLVAAACDDDSVDLDGRLVPLRVNVSGAPDVSGVTVTVTDVDSGAFFVECTDQEGVATIDVPEGNYLVHVRNLSICDPDDLTIWPERDESRVFETSGTQDATRVGVLYDVANNGSFTLNAGNYKEAVRVPLTLTQAGPSQIALEFERPGATSSCRLLNETGDVFTLADTEHIYYVITWADETGLPPAPADLPDLPRGIGSALATLGAGDQSDVCSVSGLPAGNYVIETNAVQVDGVERVFRQAFTVSEGDASSGATVPTTLAPQPPLAATGYLFDPIDEVGGLTDIGELVAYGWSEVDGRTTDTFAVSAGFVGSTAPTGESLTLELSYTDPQSGQTVQLQSMAFCTVQPDGRYSCASGGVGQDPFTVTGTGVRDADGATGTVVWTIDLPGVDSVQFRVFSEVDAAPESGLQTATKPSDDGGNSFLIIG